MNFLVCVSLNIKLHKTFLKPQRTYDEDKMFLCNMKMVIAPFEFHQYISAISKVSNLVRIRNNPNVIEDLNIQNESFNLWPEEGIISSRNVTSN